MLVTDMKQMNSILIEGTLNNNPEQNEGYVSFDLCNNGIGSTIPVRTYDNLSTWCVTDLPKDTHVSIAGRLNFEDELFIKAFYIKIKNNS